MTKNLPISYSINIKTSKRPLTCYITASPTKQINSNQSFKKLRENQSRSTIHLPVTYSTSIHLPCQSSNIKQHSSIRIPSPISYHHYHYHHYYYHHHRQPSTTIKEKVSQYSTPIASTRPATTSSTIITSPESSLLPVKNLHKNPSSTPPLHSSYSALVWNWFHHRSRKLSSSLPRKGSQSDYSETYRRESPSKRTLLFKFLSSPLENQSKSKQHRQCFTRKRSQSSFSLPKKSIHYHE